jgi:hypothetical protein
MLSFEEHTELLQLLNRYLSEFISIENAMMNCGLHAFDFNESTNQIKTITGATIDLKEKLFEYKNQPDGNYSINTAITYVDHFLKSMNQLCNISTNLARKANGGKYGFFAYRKDLKEYKNNEKVREAFGNQLNSTLGRGW